MPYICGQFGRPSGTTFVPTRRRTEFGSQSRFESAVCFLLMRAPLPRPRQATPRPSHAHQPQRRRRRRTSTPAPPAAADVSAPTHPVLPWAMRLWRLHGRRPPRRSIPVPGPPPPPPAATSAKTSSALSSPHATEGRRGC